MGGIVGGNVGGVVTGVAADLTRRSDLTYVVMLFCATPTLNMYQVRKRMMKCKRGKLEFRFEFERSGRRKEADWRGLENSV